MESNSILKSVWLCGKAISAFAGFFMQGLLLSWSNWNLETFVGFSGGRTTRLPEEKTLGAQAQSKARTNGKLNPHKHDNKLEWTGHIGWRQVLSPYLQYVIHT